MQRAWLGGPEEGGGVACAGNGSRDGAPVCRALTPLSMVCVWHTVPSAAGMLLVMHRLLLLRHHSSLQTSLARFDSVLEAALLIRIIGLARCHRWVHEVLSGGPVVQAEP